MATPDRKNLCLQSVLLRQLTKTVDSGFIRRALPAEVQSEKLFHRTGIKRLFLGLCVGKVLFQICKKHSLSVHKIGLTERPGPSCLGQQGATISMRTRQGITVLMVRKKRWRSVAFRCQSKPLQKAKVLWPKCCPNISPRIGSILPKGSGKEWFPETVSSEKDRSVWSQVV
jgi:hypothetical protein